MEPSLNLFGLVLPLALILGLIIVALGALFVGVRARPEAGLDGRGTPPTWPWVFAVAVTGFLGLLVINYILAFVI
jgi:hypothetical protein